MVPEPIYNVSMLVEMLKDAVNHDPEHAKKQLNQMLLQTASLLDQGTPDPKQIMTVKAMAMALTDKTEHLDLDLPPYTAPADVMVLNANFQKIDTAVGAMQQRLSGFQFVHGLASIGLGENPTWEQINGKLSDTCVLMQSVYRNMDFTNMQLPKKDGLLMIVKEDNSQMVSWFHVTETSEDTIIETWKSFLLNNAFSGWDTIATGRELSGKVDGKWTFMTNLSALGISTGTETIESICKAMPNGTTLEASIGSAHNLSQYPDGSYGILTIRRHSSGRIAIDYSEARSPRRWIGVYYDDAFSGWKELAAQYQSRP